MYRTDNTILVTGGGSDIGLGLAAAFHTRGNQVIIAGRRLSTLKKAAALYSGMQYRVLDQDDAGEIRRFAERITEDFPDLNVLINNAGIQRVEDLNRGALADAEATITTNLLGPIRLTAELLSALLARERATILNVTSGLAFVPSVMLPTYCAKGGAALLHAIVALPTPPDPGGSRRDRTPLGTNRTARRARHELAGDAATRLHRRDNGRLRRSSGPERDRQRARGGDVLGERDSKYDTFF